MIEEDKRFLAVGKKCHSQLKALAFYGNTTIRSIVEGLVDKLAQKDERIHGRTK